VSFQDRLPFRGAHRSFNQYLMDRDVLTASQLLCVQSKMMRSSADLCDVLVAKNILTPDRYADLRADWMGAPRAKLTDDTIAAVKAETIALARDWEEAGLMEDVAGFLAGLVIERDGSSPIQLNTLMTPNTVNGLLLLATRIEFIL